MASVSGKATVTVQLSQGRDTSSPGLALRHATKLSLPIPSPHPTRALCFGHHPPPSPHSPPTHSRALSVGGTTIAI